jgi:hypothetical protein
VLDGTEVDKQEADDLDCGMVWSGFLSVQGQGEAGRQRVRLWL